MEHAIIKSIMLIVIILGIRPILVTGQTDSTNVTTYISFVDDVLGFYKVRDVTDASHKFEYKDHTLNINQGDTVIWQNDAEKASFTVLSEQNLWDNTVGYLRVGSKLNYKFDKPGKYNIYIKEYTSRRQTVIVNSVGEQLPTPTITTPVITPIQITPVITPTQITPVITPIRTTPVPTATINKTTPIQRNSTNGTIGKVDPIEIKFPEFNMPDINLPIKKSATMMASIVVVLMSLVITYLVGRNKR